MFQVQYILNLAALAAVPVFIIIYLIAINRKKKIAKKIGDPVLVKRLTESYHPGKFTLKFLLVIVAFIAIVFALANVRSASSSESITRNGVDVMVALDVSNSMLAQDLSPTRLDRARQVVSKLIDKLGDNRIGIVIFAGKAYLQMPLTGDHSAAKMYLSGASPEAVPTQGTVIEEALKMCYLSFNSKEKKYKSVVLISDGEDHEEGAVDMAKKMASEGVIIHAVGIGSQMGAPVPDLATGQMKTDASGNMVVSRLNEASLQTIAAGGNGTYQLYSSTDKVVSNIISQVSTMDQRSVKDDSLTRYESYFQWFLGLALILLLIEMFTSEMRKKKRNVALKPAVAALLMMIPFTGFAQEDKELVKEGNNAFKNRDYKKAIESYKKAAELNAKNQAAIFNLAAALYKNKDADKSVKAYDMAIESAVQPIDRSNSHYNKGVVLQNDNKLADCIAEYKSALRINPNDADARHNLQLALKKQNEQKKKEEQQQQEKKKNSDPKPQPSRLTKKEAEEKLKALEQQEKNLHDKLKKVNANAPNKPEKDW